jgi:hypothetical protein
VRRGLTICGQMGGSYNYMVSVPRMDAFFWESDEGASPTSSSIKSFGVPRLARSIGSERTSCTLAVRASIRWSRTRYRSCTTLARLLSLLRLTGLNGSG